MSTSKQYRRIAVISKTHGRRGEVVAVARDGLPNLLKKGLQVVLVPPALKGPRQFEVTSCEGQGSSRLISFREVDGLGVARELVGKSVLVRRADLPDDFEMHDALGLIGRSVQDSQFGFVGTIDEVMRGPANDVWVVQGPLGEVLVPAVPPIVTELTIEGPIRVDLPRGLVDEERVHDTI